MRIAMWMPSSDFGVIIFFFCSILTEDTNAEIRIQSKITMPSQGSSLRLSCLLLDIELNNNKVTWKRPNDPNQFLSQCERQSGFCFNFNNGYVFTANSSGSYVDIISLNRSQHDGMWKCIYDASVGPDIEATFSLAVYTLAKGLNFIQEPGLSTDLSITTFTLRCRTTSCIYPTPVIKWLYKDAHSPDERRLYKITVTEARRENCDSSENFYSSSLELPLYTTWPNNSDITVTFSCGIEYLDFSRNIYSLDSKPVTFTVRVTWTQMQHNGQAISDTTLIVTSGEASTLTCVTGTSRPPATIDWYIGSQKIGNGTSLNFIAVNNDNEKIIYCQAYNTDPQQPVQSTQLKLFVRVRVTKVVLQKDGQAVINQTLTVTSGSTTTLTCVTGTSRPPAIIDWYIGSQKRGNGTSLNFIAVNNDNEKMIYCQAYNTDPQQPVQSIQLKLFVRAAPKILDVSPNYKGYVGQYTMIQFNFYSNTDENLTVTARHSTSSGLLHEGIIRQTLPDDVQVYSPLVLTSVFRATLAISMKSETDFGQYDVEVKNIVGSNSKIIQIIKQITPEKPINFHATNIQKKQLSLTWQSGYHGGFTQTFVVEISPDNITWNNVSQVSAGNRNGWFSTVIEGLIPGSEYYLRLYAYNINGQGDFADAQLAIRTLKETAYASLQEVGASVGIGVGGAVGGIVVGLIGAIIAFKIRRQLNGPKSSCFRSKRKTDDEMHSYSNTEMIPQTVKPIYEELNKGNTEQSVYDKISPL